MMVEKTSVARWATKGGKYYVEVQADEFGYKIAYNYGCRSLGRRVLESAIIDAEKMVNTMRTIDGHNLEMVF